jgi:hypothetical protein
VVSRKRKRVDEEQHEARRSLIQKLSSKTRSLKPWEQLSSSSEQWERLQLLRLCCKALGMPTTVVQPKQKKIPAAAVAHLENRVLKQIRDVLPVPSFNTIAAEREALADAAGMRTASFTVEQQHFTVVTDPLRCLATLTQYSRVFVIGADRGGGSTKLGVTYTTRSGVRSFAPLVTSDGKDNHPSLSLLSRPAAQLGFAFTMETAAHHGPVFGSYQAALQWLVELHQMLLNGDMPCVNAVCGLSSPTATFGCSLCTVHLRHLLEKAGPRTDEQLQLTIAALIEHPELAGTPVVLSQKFVPFLKVPAERIVPFPLHIVLGISDVIITEVYAALAGLAFIRERMQQVQHRPLGSWAPGVSEVFSLNGPQIGRWLQDEHCSAVAERVQHFVDTLPRRVTFRLDGDAIHIAYCRPRAEAPTCICILSSWMHSLFHALLHRDPWSEADIAAFDELRVEIWEQWESVAERPPTPKIHALVHIGEFARRYGAVGLYSESELESSHSESNAAMLTHRNMTQQPAERLRRAHVSVLLKRLHRSRR